MTLGARGSSKRCVGGQRRSVQAHRRLPASTTGDYERPPVVSARGGRLVRGEPRASAPDSRVADLAAGTGKLTRLLVPAGADLVAVEPVAGHARHVPHGPPRHPAGRRHFGSHAVPRPRRSTRSPSRRPGIGSTTTAPSAESRGCCARAGGSASCGTHATDRSRGSTRCGRSWTASRRTRPWRDHENWRDSVDARRMPGFGELHAAEFRHAPIDHARGVVQRVASVSHVAVLPESRSRSRARRSPHLLATHPATSEAASRSKSPTASTVTGSETAAVVVAKT